MDNNDRYDRRSEPQLRAGFSEPMPVAGRRPAAQIPAAAEFEPTYDDMKFTDVRTELSQSSKRILASARDDGFETKARPDSVTLKKGDFSETLRSNDEILGFGQARRYS